MFQERFKGINVLSKTYKPMLLTSLSDVVENIDKDSYEYNLIVNLFIRERFYFINIVDESFNHGAWLVIIENDLSREEINMWFERANKHRFWLFLYDEQRWGYNL